MLDETSDREPGLIWRDQPEEAVPVNLSGFMNQRTRELSAHTRSEILMSASSALLLVGVVSWRLKIAHENLLLLGLAAAVAWGIASLYWYQRTRLREAAQGPAVAAACLDYYRAELEHRRDHLRSVWFWHGPLLLAFLILVAILRGRVNITFQPLRNALPLLILLAVWVGFGIWRRHALARGLQREIDDLPPKRDNSNRRTT